MQGLGIGFGGCFGFFGRGLDLCACSSMLPHFGLLIQLILGWVPCRGRRRLVLAVWAPELEQVLGFQVLKPGYLVQQPKRQWQQ